MKRIQYYENDISDALTHYAAELEALQGKRILIAGATGMIGVCLTDLLMAYSQKAKKPVYILALARNEDKLRNRFAAYLEKENFSYVTGDLNTGMPRIEGRVDFIIYAASNSHPVAYAKDPVGTIKTNVIGLDYILNYAAGERLTRVVFLSSVEIYGENNLTKERFTESDCGYIDCNTLRAGYPESKRLGEALCQAYRRGYGTDVAVARLSRVYGPTMQQEDSKVISQFLKRAVQKKDIILKSDGKAKYSYLYVVDAATAILTILLKGENGEAYNAADSGSETTILELAQMVARGAGTEIVFELPEETESIGYSNVRKSLMSEEKLKRLGWKPITGLGDGIRKTIGEIRNEMPEDAGSGAFSE